MVIKSEPEEAAASAAATPVNTSKADADVEMKDASKEDENKGKENGKEDDKEKEKENAEEDTNGPDLSELFAARRAEENARRDRSLAEFLVMLDGYKPLVSAVEWVLKSHCGNAPLISCSHDRSLRRLRNTTFNVLDSSALILGCEYSSGHGRCTLNRRPGCHFLHCS